jgi:hypothetical protein
MERPSYHEYCKPLRGLIVYKNGVEKYRFLLYWHNVKISDILENKKGFSTRKRV